MGKVPGETKTALSGIKSELYVFGDIFYYFLFPLKELGQF